MTLILKILLPVLIFVGAVFAAKQIKENAPEPRRRPQFEQVLAVEATTFEPGQMQVALQSRGTARPKNENSLVPEIAGTIVELSPNFVVGGHFSAGEPLLQLDRREFEIALIQAQANVAQASAVLQEEQARSKQAKADWKSLGRKGTPSALTARVPQVAAARASLASADAQVKKAELDLARTLITAPFDGRVQEKNVAVGEFVNRGAMLGRIYASSVLEVRLPISSSQMAYLNVPGAGEGAAGDEVELQARVGNGEHTWNARIVRSEGIDTTTQQLHVVAQVNDVGSDLGESLRVGQYVTATIKAAQLENVYVLPRGAVREDREVILVEGESELRKVPVRVAWNDEEFAAVEAGGELPASPVVVTTVLGTVIDGTKVRATIDGIAPPPPQRPSGNGQRGQGQGNGQGQQGQVGGKPGADGAGKKDQGQRRPAAQAGQGAGQPASGGGDMRASFGEWRKLIDAGEPLPEEAQQRVRERIAAGGRVPPWLAAAVE